MKITTLLSAASVAAVLTGIAAPSANATPATGGDAHRAVRSPNGKDVFVHVVKVARMQAAAMRDGPMMDPARCAQPRAAKPRAQG